MIKIKLHFDYILIKIKLNFDWTLLCGIDFSCVSKHLSHVIHLFLIITSDKAYFEKFVVLYNELFNYVVYNLYTT